MSGRRGGNPGPMGALTRTPGHLTKGKTMRSLAPAAFIGAALLAGPAQAQLAVGVDPPSIGGAGSGPASQSLSNSALSTTSPGALASPPPRSLTGGAPTASSESVNRSAIETSNPGGDLPRVKNPTSIIAR